MIRSNGSPFGFDVFAKTVPRSEINSIIESSNDRKEKNNARSAIEFNLPFAVGSFLIIPTESIEINKHSKTWVFGRQNLSDNVGE